MDVRYLSLSARAQFKQSLTARRAPTDAMLKWMREQGWYTNDPVYQCFVAAQASMHAGITYNGSLPPEVHERPQPATHHSGGYPLPPMRVSRSIYLRANA